MNTYSKQQKLIKVGNSVAVTLDPDFLRAAGLTAGDNIGMEYAQDGSFVTSFPGATLKEASQPYVVKQQKTAALSSKITPELQEWVEKFLDDDAEAMKALANL